MKYMTFNSSCSYCCLANLLESHEIHKEDREIALEMGLPYLFSYDETDNAYQAGAMLQGEYWFNRYLNGIGFRFFEDMASKTDAADRLKNHTFCMIGLKTEFGKHAMIYMGQQSGNYRFLNPHRENDGQPDEVFLTEEELLDALSECNAVGHIEHTGTQIPMGAADYDNSLRCLSRYREELHQFCGAYRTGGEIMSRVNTLFRPFAVDGLAMMELVGEWALAEELRLFQKDCMTLFSRGDCRPDEIVDMARLDRIAAAYEKLILEKRNR